MSEEKKSGYTPSQDRIIHYGKENILVSASAGSGKTYTMIERIKRLVLEEKVSISKILAVTFTNASAIDMKAKLKKALMNKINDDDVDVKWLSRQIAEISTADISTIDTLCARLIRQYFFMCDVLPDFSVMDEEKTAIMMGECINQTFNEIYSENSDFYKSLFDRFYTKNDQSIKDAVIKIYKYISGRTDREEFLELYKKYDTKEYLQKTINDTKVELQKRIDHAKYELNNILLTIDKVTYKTGVKLIESILNFMNSCEGMDIYDYKFALKEMPQRRFGNNLDDYGLELKEETIALYDSVGNFVKDIASVHKSYAEDVQAMEQDRENNEQIVKIVKRFSEIYEKSKKEENVLDFSDLERNALIILSDEDTACDIRNKYEYVFVDECQDINPLQNEIINKLSDKNLFMVGDNKQSIYGFRGTSPEFFTEKEKEMEKNNEKTERLNYNYRSSQEVIDTVNKIFDYCMTEKYFGENYATTSRLESGGIYPEDAIGRSQLHFYEKAPRKKIDKKDDENFEEPRIYDVLDELDKKEEKAEDDVSSLIIDIIDKELEDKFYDISDKTYKNVTYGDIAIITRSADNVYIKNLVQKLRLYGIPVDSKVSVDIREYPEILMMINVIKLIDCFENDVPLVSTLKSPVGSVTDEELMEIVRFYYENKKHKARNFFTAFNYFLENAKIKSQDYFEDEKESILLLYDKLINFTTYFNNLRYVSDFIGSFGVIEKVINDFNIESYLLSEKLGNSKIRRLHKFLYASLNGEKKLTIREFVYKIENCPKAFEFSDDTEQDSVQVMTMHSSKGLEFPVVILLRLENPFSKKDVEGKVLINKDFGVHFKYFDKEEKLYNKTWITHKLEEELKSQNEKEEMRLFYVATTRAKYSLHLVFSEKEDDRKTIFNGAEKMIDYVPLSIPATCHNKDEFEFIEQEKPVRTVILAQSDNEIAKVIGDNILYKYGYAEDTVLPLKSNVTASVKSDENKENLVHVLFDEPSPDTERGTIAHKVMECFDFKDREHFDEQIKNMTDNGILTAEQLGKINLERIKGVINQGVFDNVKDWNLYREKPFLVNVPANMIMDTKSSEMVLLQGVIDLLCINKDEAIIIDYKYSSLTKESLKIKYKKQLDLYAYAVNKVLDKTIVKKALVNIFTGDTVIID